MIKELKAIALQLERLERSLDRLAKAYEKLARVCLQSDRTLKLLEYENVFLRADLEMARKKVK